MPGQTSCCAGGQSCNGQDINAGIHGAVWRFDLGDDSSVAIALEVINARPVVGQVWRLEKENFCARSMRIED